MAADRQLTTGIVLGRACAWCVMAGALCALLLGGCASMPTKERRAAEAAQLGLVSHPELADVRVQLDLVNRRIDTLLERLAAMEEAHRDDTEMVIADLRRFVDELKSELKKQP